MERLLATPPFRRLVAAPLIALLVFASIVTPTAGAGIVSTERALAAPEQVQGERERLLAVIDRTDVQERLVAHGVDPAHAAERAASLTEAEAAEMNARIDELPAGGSAVALLLVIIILLLVLR